MTNDAELLHRYVTSGSEEAFAELVHRHLGLVYSVALRKVAGDAHLAQDVTQKVFTELAREAAGLTRHPLLSGWLYRSACFNAVDVMRSEHRRRVREQEAQTMHELTTSSDSIVDGDTLRPVLDEVMDELNDRDRDAVILRFFEGRPFAEVGQKLQLTEDAARMRVDRALVKMRTLLMRRGVTSTTAALTLVLSSEAVAAVPAGLAATVTNVALASAAAMTATVGGGTATTLTLLHLMNTTKSIAIVTTAVALLAMGTAYNEYTEVHQTRPALDAANLAQKNLRNQLADEAHTIKSLQSQIALLQDELAAMAKQPLTRLPNAAVVNTGGGNQPPPANAPAQLSLTADQVQQNIQLVVNAHVPLFRALNLSQAQANQFANLLTTKQQAAFTAAQAAIQQGADAATAKQMIAEAKAGVDAQIQTLVGDTIYSQYQQYEQTFPQRNFAGDLQKVLSNSPNPLSDDQANQLVPLLSQTGITRGADSLLSQINGGINARSQPTDQTVSQAESSGVLSPAQLQMMHLMQQSMATRSPILQGADGKPALGAPLPPPPSTPNGDSVPPTIITGPVSSP